MTSLSHCKGISALETILLLMAVVTGLGILSSYMQGAMIGQWKRVIDESGTPYDYRPGHTTGSVITTMGGESLTKVNTVNTGAGGANDPASTTIRIDKQDFLEKKKGGLLVP